MASLTTCDRCKRPEKEEGEAMKEWLRISIRPGSRTVGMTFYYDICPECYGQRIEFDLGKKDVK